MLAKRGNYSPAKRLFSARVMTRRDEMQLQRLLHITGRKERILLSPRTYRAARHHPHFRFFMHRFGKHSADIRGQKRLSGITGMWFNEAESVGQTPKESV